MRKKKIGIGLSGGVDSAVTAALLCQAGYEVTAVTMLLIDAENKKALEKANSMIEDARQVADSLSIKHHVIDLRVLFKQYVIDEFIAAYTKGQTPNPCIKCNQHIKFTALLAYCQRIGIEKIATGHYAQILCDCATGEYSLWKGIDTKKDQSYVLYSLPRKLLPSILMPLGRYTKKEVRVMAEKFCLPIAKKRESQDICFIPDNNYKAYLAGKLSPDIQLGNVVDLNGTVLGNHQGIPFYTIGQRKGLGVAVGKPMYVVQLNTEKKQVVVGEDKDLLSYGLFADEVNWQAFRVLEGPLVVTAKIRYGASLVPVRVVPCKKNEVKVLFCEPQRAVTPGQSIVFYRGDCVLGGARIKQPICQVKDRLLKKFRKVNLKEKM